MPSSIKSSKVFFSLVFILVLYVVYRMFQPFLVSIILAVTIVSIFYNNYLELNRRLKGRSNLSSALMCLIVTTLIIIPLLFLLIAMLKEFAAAYEVFKTKLAAGTFGKELYWPENAILDAVRDQFVRFFPIEGWSVTLGISSLFDRVADYLMDHYVSILGGVGALFFKFSVMVFSMFFFFRDGEVFLQEVKRLIPLAPEHKDLVLSKLKEVTYATFFGIFATAFIQGIVAALIFLLLGINNAILWGMTTAVFSALPLLGTSTVWLPMSIYLILSGKILKGVILLVLGGSILAVVDNLVRPLIIEGKARGMHLLLVFFSLVGGLFLFGPSGLILGPLLGALFLTFLEIYKIEYGDQLG